MTEDFRAAVEAAFLFLLPDLDRASLAHEAGASFDDATVVVRGPAFRVRILRERGQVFLDFAPPDGPPLWFDAPLLAQYFGRAAEAEAHVASGQRSLSALAEFVRPLVPEVRAAFSAENRKAAMGTLQALREENSRRRWDWVAAERPSRVSIRRIPYPAPANTTI